MKLKRKILFYVTAIFVISITYSAVNKEPASVSIPEPEITIGFELISDSNLESPKLKIRAKSAILIDLISGEVLARKNEDEVRSIASLTKLATAILFLETDTDMFDVVTITREDKSGAGRSRLYTGMKLTVYDLFHIMLISSDNVAARALARSTGFTNDEFAQRMNELANSLNLTHTAFAEPTGLDAGNVSTASEVAILFKYALDYPMISEAISRRNFTYKALNRERQYIAYNTNRMLYRSDVFGGKTGYIKPSGYCLALRVDDENRHLGALILGSTSNRNRYRDAVRLLACAKKT
jgi:D-alanyl-D-alanine endopeptidase (penicillin-binding protein 7)